ncbi:MAG: hypothetical protein J7559_01685 [Cohnella sp.]|nr:hypothetical protein [Cohnella sp.]
MSHCHYHEASEAVRACERCGKQLCEQCFHADYPDYCWSCGLAYSNDLVEREQAFHVPPVLRGTVVRYVAMKLAAVGATYMSLALFFGLFGLIGGLRGALYVFAVTALISMNVLYTYGIAYSLLADGFLKLAKKDNVYLGAIAYGIGGVLFPYVWSWGESSAPPSFYVIGVLCSLVFYGMQRIFRPEHRHGSRWIIALITLVPASLLLIAFGLPLHGMLWENWLSKIM